MKLYYSCHLPLTSHGLFVDLAAAQFRLDLLRNSFEVSLLIWRLLICRARFCFFAMLFRQEV